MFARLSAKAIVLVAGVALVFFGVGLIGLGIAASLLSTVDTEFFFLAVITISKHEI